jgi:phage terminase large subunit
MNAALAERSVRTIQCQIPHKLGFLFDLHRYKVAYGGRGAAKSQSFARALLTLGAAQKLRILCTREVQKSIKDSVHKLLGDLIESMGLGKFYEVLETEIRGRNGTEIIFAGLRGQTVESIKSYEGVDIAWVEEAQAVSKRSWDILIPTIRAENSELWVSFNPDMDTDETYKRFIERKPTGAIVVKMNWQDNPWFPAVLNQERLDCQRNQAADYDNIWEGKPRSAVVGAIYAKEMAALVAEGRLRPTPYDPMLPVHTIWDLGWNDAMVIGFVQRPTPTAINLINYIEDSFHTYAEYVRDMEALGYRWGQHWLPHDARNKDPKSGMSTVQVLRKLRLRNLRVIGRGDVEQGIRNVRMLLPRLYIDNTERQRTTGYMGGSRLIECLKRYRRNVPTTTGEPSTPVHDEFSHGADMIRGLATIAHLIRNETEEAPMPVVEAFSNPVPGMGMLG